MNSTILSLLLSALGQFGGFGGLGGLGGIGGGLLPGLGVSPGSGFGPGSGGVVTTQPGYYPGGPGPRSLPARTLPVQTLAVVQCLYQQGMVSDAQAQQLLQRQGARRGWPSGWENSIDPGQVNQAITSAGGCRPLMAALQRSGSLIAAQPGYGRGDQPGYGRPWGGTNGFIPGPGPGGSRSEAEAFGLAPYR